MVWPYRWLWTPLPVTFVCLLATVVPAPLAAASNRGQFLLNAHRERRAGQPLELPVAPPLTTAAPRIGVDDTQQPLGYPVHGTDIPKPLFTPPPSLEPWDDLQPADTLLGYWLVDRLTVGPTLTPPPIPISLEIASNCPVLNLPVAIEVDAPDPCRSWSEGRWRRAPGAGPGEKEILRWSLMCRWFTPELEKAVVYREYTSGLDYGVSETAVTLVGNVMELRDCAGMLRYTIHEKVYHEAGKGFQEACEKYGSCDGTVWLQYFVYTRMGELVAQTAYLHIFDNDFTIFDGSQAKVALAQVTRLGSWSPMGDDCDGPRKYGVRFLEGSSSILAGPSNRWPIAQMVTMISVRDMYRRPNGLIGHSTCGVVKGSIIMAVLAILLGSLCWGSVLFMSFGDPLRAYLYHLEVHICPPRMRKPMKYEGT